jgi:hypothetical protein
MRSAVVASAMSRCETTQTKKKHVKNCSDSGKDAMQCNRSLRDAGPVHPFFPSPAYHVRCYPTRVRAHRPVLDQQLTSDLSVRTLGVLGAGQMGLGIAYVAALRAQVPRVLLCDRSEPQITRSLALMDRLLAKDVQKGRLSDVDARAARERIVVVKEGISGLGECDMVVEVRSCMWATVPCTEYFGC